MSGGGEINAHFTSPPFHQRERKSANIRTIMTSNDVMGGPSTFTMPYTTAKFHDENPKVYGAFLKALEAAIGLSTPTSGQPHRPSSTWRARA